MLLQFRIGKRLKEYKKECFIDFLNFKSKKGLG